MITRSYLQMAHWSVVQNEPDISEALRQWQHAKEQNSI
jgi:hypothetical protein